MRATRLALVAAHCAAVLASQTCQDAVVHAQTHSTNGALAALTTQHDTGITVGTHETVTFTVQPGATWWFAQRVGGDATADGSASKGYLNDFLYASLVGGIDDGEVFLVGESKQLWVASGGSLRLAFWDIPGTDNSGEITVHVCREEVVSLGRNVLIKTPEDPPRYIRHDEDGGLLGLYDAASATQMQFTQALYPLEGYLSIQDVASGHYLRRGLVLRPLAPSTQYSELEQEDASFLPYVNADGTCRFESLNYPGYYLAWEATIPYIPIVDGDTSSWSIEYPTTTTMTMTMTSTTTEEPVRDVSPGDEVEVRCASGGNSGYHAARVHNVSTDGIVVAYEHLGHLYFCTPKQWRVVGPPQDPCAEHGGILPAWGGHKCCPVSCGECGTPDCHLMPGGRGRCCTSRIPNDKVCGVQGNQAPCSFVPELPGDVAPAQRRLRGLGVAEGPEESGPPGAGPAAPAEDVQIVA